MSMANMKTKYFILTGDPGVGKTTLIKKLSQQVGSYGVKTAGFYTEEVRQARVREGFDLVTLDGVRCRLARYQGLLKTPVKQQVGKYGVLVQEFASVALEALKLSEPQTLLVIDEIGKMEFFSNPFKARIKEIFMNSGNFFVLATIPVRKSDPLIEIVRVNSRAKVWMVTKENRNILHEDVLKEIKNSFYS